MDTGETSGAERRAARRVQLLKFAWYRALDGEPVEGLARGCDVSLTGAALYAAQELPAGTRLFVEIVSGELCLSAVGVVVWSAPAEGGQVKLGLRFEVVPPNDRLSLMRFCGDEQP